MVEKCKIVLLGGGTGNAVFLKTLKNFPCDITAIVSVADDGGSSGTIRQDYGILPPGDIRNCIVALADEESVMAELMDFRFSDGFMKTQSFGNIMITAMHQIWGNFPLAVKMVSDVLAIKGRVLPVTTTDITLCAETRKGKTIEGESKIPKYCISNNDTIEKMFLYPSASAFSECIEAIESADIIVYSPGSLFTSLIPNLIVENITDALEKSKARKYYMQNIMTQNGETSQFTLNDHLQAIEKHINGKKIIDTVVYNTGRIQQFVLDLYEQENSYPVIINEENDLSRSYEYLAMDLVFIENNMIRHNSNLFWEYIFYNHGTR